MSRFNCLVESVSYTGGIIGAFSDKKTKLQEKIQEHNDQGYRLRQVLPVKTTVFDLLVQLIFLTITLLFWSPEKGETLVFERAEDA